MEKVDEWGKATEGYFHLVSVRLRSFIKICMSYRYIGLYEYDEMHLYHKSYR